MTAQNYKSGKYNLPPNAVEFRLSDTVEIRKEAEGKEAEGNDQIDGSEIVHDVVEGNNNKKGDAIDNVNGEDSEAEFTDQIEYDITHGGRQNNNNENVTVTTEKRMCLVGDGKYKNAKDKNAKDKNSKVSNLVAGRKRQHYKKAGIQLRSGGRRLRRQKNKN